MAIPHTSATLQRLMRMMSSSTKSGHGRLVSSSWSAVRGIATTRLSAAGTITGSDAASAEAEARGDAASKKALAKAPARLRGMRARAAKA